MNYKKMIIGISIVAVLFVSFGISDSEAFPITDPCATGDCKFNFATNFSYYCPPYTRTEQEVGNDVNFNYPYGLIGFVVSSGIDSVCDEDVAPVTAQRTAQVAVSGTVTLTFYKASDDSPLDLTGLVYRKYGPTPDNPTPHWYDFMYDGTTGAVITGNQVVLYFVDGQRGDDDLTPDAVIRDQGGSANGVANVPTMNEWGMIIFMVLAGLGSVYYLRRQRRTES